MRDCHGTSGASVKQLWCLVVPANCTQVKLSTMATALGAPCDTIFDEATSNLLGSAECSVSSEVRPSSKVLRWMSAARADSRELVSGVDSAACKDWRLRMLWQGAPLHIL